MNTQELLKAKRTVSALWHKIRLTDRGRLSAQYHKFHTEFGRAPEEAVRNLLPDLLEKLQAAEKNSFANSARKLKCEFPDDLPITAKIPEIRAAIKDHQVVIVCGSTGSGKTTQLPKAALLEGRGRTGRIGCTQPRRIAATALAERFAAETGAAPGVEVGCKVRFDDRTTDATCVKFMTDGILLAETRSDPMLLQYDCIILDEVHERSLNIDFLLGYLKLLLPKRRDLRIIISSATLESGRISEFFGGAPVIEVEGKLFPIEDIFLDNEDDMELAEAIAQGCETLAGIDPDGDILVFLPGEREIRDAADMLTGRNYPRTEVLPLFGRLSAGEQNKIFQRSGKRRIVLATNVAETSLTIPGIRFVIDSGLVRLSRFNPRNGIQELRIEFISKASARQRRGRCGRLRDGVCVHLYSEEKLTEADDYTAPEIQRSGLAGVILQMASLKLPDIEDFPFVDPPSPALIREGRITLDDLGATDEHRRLTRIGHELAKLPVGPRIGKMILEAGRHGVLQEILVLAAFLSLPDPRERPFDHAANADAAQKKFDAPGSDFLSALNLWRAMNDELDRSKSALRKFAKANYLNFRRLREWLSLTEDLTELAAPDLLDKKLLYGKTVKNGNTGFVDLNGYYVNSAAVHRVLMSALPRRLGMFDPENKCYIDRNGKKFQIFPASVLARNKIPAKWILSFTVVETTRPYARCNAEVEPQWLEETAPRLCSKTYDSIRWNPESGFVTAREKVMAGQLPIHPGRRCHYGKIDPAKARQVFIREALATGALHLPGISWVQKFETFYRDITALEIKHRRPDSMLDAHAVQAYFERVLPPHICSADDVARDFRNKKRGFCPRKEDMVFDPDALADESDFPDFILQSGAKIPLQYEFEPGEKNDGITLLVPENDLHLLEPHVQDWLVPGYLPWKVEAMLRSLPKSIRREITPVGDCAEEFVNAVKSGEVFQDQRFEDALKEWLYEEHRLDTDFAGYEPEDFLKMKIAVTGRNGKILRTLDKVPNVQQNGSKLVRTPRSTVNLQKTGCMDWPENIILPENVSVSPDGKKLAYPALCDEGGSVGISLYLNQAEAAAAHAAGLRRLVRLILPQLAKHLRGTPKFPYGMELTLFLDDPVWRESMLDAALDKSWGCDPWKIRSEQDFRNALGHLRDCAAENLSAVTDNLCNVFAAYGKMEKFLNKLPSNSRAREDAEQQLAFLFRPGFLRTGGAVDHYKRYLRALAVRLERALQGEARDTAKGENLAPYIKNFHILADSREKPLEADPALLEFFLLLQEARINTWSPEIPTARKVSPAVLEKAWKEITL